MITLLYDLIIILRYLFRKYNFSTCRDLGCSPSMAFSNR